LEKFKKIKKSQKQELNEIQAFEADKNKEANLRRLQDENNHKYE